MVSRIRELLVGQYMQAIGGLSGHCGPHRSGRLVFCGGHVGLTRISAFTAWPVP